MKQSPASNPPQDVTKGNKARRRLNTQLLSAVLLIIVGSALLIAGFIVPPMGVIDNSVLIAFGEILTFVGALFGIDYRAQLRFFNFKERHDRKTNTPNG